MERVRLFFRNIEWRVLLLVVGVVSGQTAQSVSLPLWISALAAGNAAAPYFILFFASLAYAVFFNALHAIRVWRGVKMPDHSQVSVWPMLLTGVFDGFNGILVVFASDPTRTPPFLQSVLQCFIVPMTIVSRILYTHFVDSRTQLLCAAAVVVGLFISLIPTIFDLGEASPAAVPLAKGAGRVLWPLCFLLGMVPAAMMGVLEEVILKTGKATVTWRKGPCHFDTKESLLKEEQEEAARALESATDATQLSLADSTPPKPSRVTLDSTIQEKGVGEVVGGGMLGGGAGVGEEEVEEVVDQVYFLTYSMWGQIATIALFFWVDIIPGFGTSPDLASMGTRLATGFSCFFFGGLCSDGSAFIRGMVFIAAFVISYLANAALLNETAGANYSAVINVLITPIAALFWSFFISEPFHFEIHANLTTWCSLGGLILILPAIYFYDHSRADGGSIEREALDTLHHGDGKEGAGGGGEEAYDSDRGTPKEALLP